ncbi:HPF/RaiA family ribosome-associated protein [Sphingomonas baiyangensis]|uniref:HPF/RaiA family ribosome-associated protein n=1 Tax=Sphingomonas baiyangensis TaxID=2572576 RepID=A0A4V5PU63_9SPHN|nr:HPF/RaiA family ribosome-associated protein [Sphingomonas baiyangensis]TKD52838.1 HPF/RaiA family ribosome-associated protein [Sphingomonas baiyangensis]
MDFLFHSDDRIEGGNAMADAAEARIRERTARFADRLTRIETRLRDIDGDTNGADGIEASIEARPAGAQPIVVTDRAAQPQTAMNGALQKLIARLESDFGKADRVR